MTSGENLMRMVVLGLESPSEATEWAVTLPAGGGRGSAQHCRGSREMGVGVGRGAYLAGNPEDFSTPSTIPAAKAPQLRWPISLGTEMNLLTSRSWSLIMYSSSACV